MQRIDGYVAVAEIVLHHHERFGGGGYPAGIAAEEIPLGARIIAAADTYDVMTARRTCSRRPVSLPRPPWPSFARAPAPNSIRTSSWRSNA